MDEKIFIYDLPIPDGIINFQFADFRHIILEKNSVPNSVKRMNLGNENTILIEPYAIPNSVTRIDIGTTYVKIYPHSIPNSVTYLEINNNSNKIEYCMLPKNLEYLHFKYYFNKPIKPFMIPNSVKTLIFSIIFNQDIELFTIPYGVEKLYFGEKFKKRIKNDVIPNSVKELKLYNINEISKKGLYIPNSVTHLYTDHIYEKINELPNSIIYLELNYITSKEIYIPYHIKHLTIKYIEEKLINDDIFYKIIPENVISLKMCQQLHYLKNKIYIPKHITLYQFCFYGRKINIDHLLDRLYKDLILIITIHYTQDVDRYNELCNMVHQDYAKFIVLDNFDCDNNKSKHIETLYEIRRRMYLGKIIFEELIKEVFNPKRIEKLSIKYNTDFIDILEMYE
jgi:hypothetical protein